MKVTPRDVLFDAEPAPKGLDFLKALVAWRAGLYPHAGRFGGERLTPEDVAWDDAEFKRWVTVLMTYKRLTPYLGKVARRFDPLDESSDPDNWPADDEETLERL